MVLGYARMSTGQFLNTTNATFRNPGLTFPSYRISRTRLSAIGKSHAVRLILFSNPLSNPYFNSRPAVSVHRIALTTPPSTRKAAPFVAEESSLAT